MVAISHCLCMDLNFNPSNVLMRMMCNLIVQGAKGHYKGIGDCVSKIIKEEGAGALLKVHNYSLYYVISRSKAKFLMETTSPLVCDSIEVCV